MKKLSALIAVIAMTFAVAGCNTVKGVGKDVEKGGEKVQDAASNVQKKM